MTFLNQSRLPASALRLDLLGIREGLYSDHYFVNSVQLLEKLSAVGEVFAGTPTRPIPTNPAIPLGDLVVEAQLFTRRAPYALVAGVDVCLALLRGATGYFGTEHFIPTWQQLAVEAIHDGQFVQYAGNPADVSPVLKIRGRYRDFALLETPMLGYLARASRLATTIYDTFIAANGKSLLFFPARFDIPETQALDGYAYWVALQRYNHDYQRLIRPLVSTDVQALWWNGQGGGTVPHALIACFFGDTAETLRNFATYMPPEIPRVALADFNNDVIQASLSTAAVFWRAYLTALQQADLEGQKRWTLYGVRLDTSASLRDAALQPDDAPGVSPKLVHLVREALNHAWESWDVPEQWQEAARAYCHQIKIIVSGGFSRARIMQFEQAGVPVDSYGVGSSLLLNDSTTNTDYTMDIVRVKLGDQWVEMAKTGRRANPNPDLQRVDLSTL